MLPTSAPSSRLPKLRPEQRSNPLTYDGTLLHAGTGGPSHVSSSTIASAHRALHSHGSTAAGHLQQDHPDHHRTNNRNGGCSRTSYRTNTTTTTTPSGVFRVLASDSVAVSYSLSSLHTVSTGVNSVNNNTNSQTASSSGASRFRFPPDMPPHLRQPKEQQQQLFSSPPYSHRILAAAAALPVQLGTSTPAQESHLEYTGQSASLSPQLYLPELQASQGQQQRGSQEFSMLGAADGLMQLQDDTTGLLVRHPTPELQDNPSQEACVTVAAAAAANGERTKSPASPAATVAAAYDAARAEALMRAAPFVSAAMLDAGVDDRINPFLLDKLIRHGRRQAAAAAAKSKGKAGSAAKTGMGLPPTSSPADAGDATGKEAATADRKARAASTVEETRYHEPLALQAAYNAIASPVANQQNSPEKDTEGARNLRKSSADGSAFAEILAEYASDARNKKTAAGTPHSNALLQAKLTTTTHRRNNDASASLSGAKATLLMSSPDYTRLASASSANDAAFIRQLVNYYTARAHATSATLEQKTNGGKTRAKSGVTRLPLSAAALESVKSQVASSSTALKNTSKSDTLKAVPALRVEDTSDTTNISNGNNGANFSLLNAVLSVSREYVEVQASENGLPGKGTAALSERRRHLQRQLVTLDQTRIPESLWVTCAPPLSRLTAVTSTTASFPSRTSNSQYQTTQRELVLTEHDGSNNGGGNGSVTNSDAAVPAAAAVTTCNSYRLTVASGGGSRHGESDQIGASVEDASIVATQREDNAHNSRRPRGASNNNNNTNNNSVGNGTSVANTIFPAARPVDRSQVYMLADVLDRMLHDPAHPQWVELLSNPEIARYVISEKSEADAPSEKDGEDMLDLKSRAVGTDGSFETPDGDTYEAMWGPPGEQRLMAYTDAAHQVLDILDTGLSELVRQVTCHCTERGALLDLLRQSIVDIAVTQVNLLSQVKRQARQDAATALALRAANRDLCEQLKTAQHELKELQATHAQLQARIEPIQRKSDRLDELMARVSSKARRFETHRHDEHIALLQLLEESMKQTASTAVDNFYNEMNGVHIRHIEGDAAEYSTNDHSSGGEHNIPLMLDAEMPSVAAARTRAAEQRQTMARMYEESHQLLRVLHDTVEATNAVCAPLYKKMMLADVSPIAKVTTSKWATIARAVGAFEKEKRHRQRVYEIFTEYCTVFRHEQAAVATSSEKNAGGLQNSGALSGDSNVSTGFTARSYGESFLVDNSSANGRKGEGGGDDGANCNPDDVNARVRALQQRVPQSLGDAAAVMTTTAARGAGPPATTNPFGVIITHGDLEAMGATDCSVEEVNALFRKDFDVRAYLRGSWEDYIHDRRLHEAASGVEDAYTLRLPDLLQMLSDLHATLAEVTTRMRAMADSRVLQVLLQPPLEPPAHPEIPCPLCSRRDSAEMDRQRRREAMSRIARDLQGKMDAVEAKSRAAQLERDEAKREVHRLQMELQQVSKGNPPVLSQPGGGSNSSASRLKPRKSSTSPFRRERRDTSTPRTSNLPWESFLPNASTRSWNNGNGSGIDDSASQHRSQHRSQRSSRKSSSSGVDLSPSRRSSSSSQRL